MTTTEPVTSQAVATVAPIVTLATPEQIARLVFNGDAIRSKKDALALAKTAGISRRAVETALADAWRKHSADAAALGAVEMSRAAAAGHKVDRKVSKTGRITYAIAPKAMGEKGESLRDKVARLEAELAKRNAVATPEASA